MNRLEELAFIYMKKYYTYMGHYGDCINVLVWENSEFKFEPHEELEIVERSRQQNGSMWFRMQLIK